MTTITTQLTCTENDTLRNLVMKEAIRLAEEQKRVGIENAELPTTFSRTIETAIAAQRTHLTCILKKLTP